MFGDDVERRRSTSISAVVQSSSSSFTFSSFAFSLYVPVDVHLVALVRRLVFPVGIPPVGMWEKESEREEEGRRVGRRWEQKKKQRPMEAWRPIDFSSLLFPFFLRSRASFEHSNSTYRYTWNSFMSGALVAGAATAAAGAAAAAADAAEAEEEETDGADAARLDEGGACAGGPEVVVMAARQRFVVAVVAIAVVEDGPTSLPRAAAVRAAASMAKTEKKE